MELEVVEDIGKSLDSNGTELPSLQSMTKLEVIDYELNRNGMGRYHWLIWAICGTGFLLDVMWTQAYGLALPSIQREFGFTDKELGNISAAYAAGIFVGAFVWGTLVDVVGRRVAFYGTSLMSGTFGICFGIMPSFASLQAMVAFVGFGIGGNIPVDTTIALEYLPKKNTYLLVALALFAQLGSVTCTALAFAFIPNFSCSPNLVSCHSTGGTKPCCSRGANMGWRYLFFALGSITLLIFITRFFIFPFYESPKFLATKRKDRDAVAVVQKVAAFNGHPCDLTVELLHERCKLAPIAEKIALSRLLISEISKLKVLFGSGRMARVAILLWITWMFDYGAVAIANTYLPTILQRKNIAMHISLSQTYLDYLIINAAAVVGVGISVVMVWSTRIGRKWTLVFASVMMSASLFLYSVVNTQTGHVGFNALMAFFQYIFNAVLWGWTPEAFPTAVRGTAAGFAMLVAAVFSVVAPLIVEQVTPLSSGSNGVLYLAGGGLLVCTLAVLCIPTKQMLVSRKV